MNAETRAKELFPLAFGETLSPEQAAFRDRIAAAIRQAERDARVQVLTSVRDAIDRSDSANDYPAWKSEALIVDMINTLIILEKD